MRREPGKPAIAVMARNGRYAGGAFITLPSGIRERLWQRIEEKAGPAPKRLKTAEAAKWVKPGIVERVRYLRGEDPLRHATLKD